MFKKRTRASNISSSRSSGGPSKLAEDGLDKSGDREQSRARLAIDTGDGEDVQADDGDDDERPTETLQELLLLRKLAKQTRTPGIDLVRLNAGEEKKRKKKKKAKATSGDDEDVSGSGSDADDDGHGLQKKSAVDHGHGQGLEQEDDGIEENDEIKTRRLVRSNNFTQQTNALDVDKHMMAFIEAELAKRRGEHSASLESGEKDQEVKFDPQEELYKIAEKYRLERKDDASGPGAGKGKGEEDEGGDVGASLGMLTTIPEVDLGMEARLKNIEETERAKKAMMQSKRGGGAGLGGGYGEQSRNEGAGPRPRGGDEASFAAARFYRPNARILTDSESLEDARREAMGLPSIARNKSGNGMGGRNQATDDMVYERFKKRMRK